MMVGLREVEHACAVGTFIDVAFDADAGALDFAMTIRTQACGKEASVTRVRSASPLTGFPKNACLRPWVHLCNDGDEVVLQGRQ